LSKGEQKGTEIVDETIEELRIKGSRCIVGRLGEPKKLNKDAFKAILVRIWRPAGRLIFKEILDNLWLFEFSDERDKQKVMAGRPWSYDRTLLILNDFDGQVPPSQMDFSCTHIWIQIRP
jgi:hypothetical protein